MYVRKKTRSKRKKKTVKSICTPLIFHVNLLTLIMMWRCVCVCSFGRCVSYKHIPSIIIYFPHCFCHSCIIFTDHGLDFWFYFVHDIPHMFSFTFYKCMTQSENDKQNMIMRMDGGKPWAE